MAGIAHRPECKNRHRLLNNRGKINFPVTAGKFPVIAKKFPVMAFEIPCYLQPSPTADTR
jgi:hypothetical protein